MRVLYSEKVVLFASSKLPEAAFIKNAAFSTFQRSFYMHDKNTCGDVVMTYTT